MERCYNMEIVGYFEGDNAMKTAIVTDSTAYLSQSELKKYHITVAPIPVIFNGKSYREGVDIDLQLA